MKTPYDVLNFWFSDASESRWYNSNPAFDAKIARQFEDTAKALAQGPFPHTVWEANPQSALALIICLDQFPRNIYRGSPKAFAWDGLALGVAERMVGSGWDHHVTGKQRAFIYMPYMHAEDLVAQERCVELTNSLTDKSTHRHAKAHRDIIAQFGRFPHRNETLGRKSTAEEREFLADGGYDPS